MSADEAMGRLVCATLTFDGGSGNALAAALPDYLVLKLSEIPGVGQHAGMAVQRKPLKVIAGAWR
jgi:hypothetical protein